MCFLKLSSNSFNVYTQIGELLFSSQKKSLYQRTSAKMPFVIDFSERRKRIAV
nr:MAG TPA: hypothetical protein [Caudoviricetes sp.]